MAAGTGLVVARKPGGSWTPPSALALYSCGWGLQFGGVLSDLLIVLRNQCALSLSSCSQGCQASQFFVCVPD